MKKFLTFFAFAVLTAAACTTLTACSDDDDDDKGTVPKTELEAKEMFIGVWKDMGELLGEAKVIAEAHYYRFRLAEAYDNIIKLKKEYGGKYYYNDELWSYYIEPDADNPSQGKIFFDEGTEDECVGYYQKLTSKSMEMQFTRDYNDNKFHKFKKVNLKITDENSSHSLFE